MSISTLAQPACLADGHGRTATSAAAAVRRILVFGHLGVGNIGDEAMLPGVLQSVRESWPEADVVIAAGDNHGLRAARTGKATFVPRTFASLLQAMWRCDAFVLAGGTHLASFRNNRRHTFGILRHLVLYRLAKTLGLRVYLVGVGLGPFETPVGESLARLAVRAADYVSVRERASLEFLAGSGLAANRYGLSDDPALWLTLPPRQLAGPHLGVSVMPYHRHYTRDTADDCRLEQRICEMIDDWFARHGDGRVSLIGFYSAEGDSDDVAIARRIAARISDPRVSVIDPAGRLDLCLDAFRSFSHFVAMRYHSQVLASMFGIPQAVIAYHRKNHDFAEETGLPPERIVDIQSFVRGEGQAAFATLFQEPVSSDSHQPLTMSRDRLRRLLPRETTA